MAPCTVLHSDSNQMCFLYLLQAQQQLQDVGFEREDAMAAVEKLHSVIEMVQIEMADAQEAADRSAFADMSHVA